MASRYYGLNAGETDKDVVEGSSTGTKHIELVVTDAFWSNPRLVIEGLDQIKEYLIRANFPPA